MATKQALSPLDALFNAAVSTAKADDVLKAAFIKAGGNQDEPKRVLLSARISHSLKCTREKSLQVLAKKGNPKHNPAAGDDVRTIVEEQAYGAARGYLTACLKRWGLQTTEGRGGDRTSDKDVMDTEKLVPAGKPKVSNSVELAAYCAAYAKAGYDMFLLNKGHSAVTSQHGSELMGAFADFVATIAEINGKFAK